MAGAGRAVIERPREVLAVHCRSFEDHLRAAVRALAAQKSGGGASNYATVNGYGLVR